MKKTEHCYYVIDGDEGSSFWIDNATDTRDAVEQYLSLVGLNPNDPTDLMLQVVLADKYDEYHVTGVKPPARFDITKK
jgi:hypothetical protein